MQDIMEEGAYAEMDGHMRPEVPAYNEEEYDDEEEEMDPAMEEDKNAALDYDGFEKIINTEGQTSNQTTELRKANFIRRNTASYHMVQAIKTGD